ncbi:hypothetical protein GW17_00042115 [Ensete ventricosum]|nr:hypothetical protein GW17_00042115 [Ensete ventricosum]RZR97378.1 hypothetical protein BHM03_00026550 [Ensete ventricosum]
MLLSLASLHLRPLAIVCHSSPPLLSLPTLLLTSRARREHHYKSSATNRGQLSFRCRCHPLLSLGICCRVSLDPSRYPHLLPLLPSAAAALIFCLQPMQSHPLQL